MNIIIVGCGKVGQALAGKLCDENHNIVLVDIDEKKVDRISEDLDVLGCKGNGASIKTLTDAGVRDADLLIAVTGSDELNLLCCMFAKKAGHCKMIARVRNPVYNYEQSFIKEQLGISAIINPELAAAVEISLLLRFPAASKVDTFAGGKVCLQKIPLLPEYGLCGVAIKDISARLSCDVLVCAVERGEQVLIPDGEFCLQNGDIISLLFSMENANSVFKRMGKKTRAKNCLIVGGGMIGYYLAHRLLDSGVQVRIIDKDPIRCDQLADLLPEATILCGDGTDRRLLLEEGLPAADSFVALTNMDEENILMSLFAKKHGHAKLVTKLNRLEFDDILHGLDVGSTVYPKYMTCDYILQYVRALQNKAGNNLKTLYRILDDRVEALEFSVQEKSDITDIPLSELSLKKNLLICCITRGDKIIIPRGEDTIRVGDTVILITLEHHGLNELRDILRRRTER